MLWKNDRNRTPRPKPIDSSLWTLGNLIGATAIGVVVVSVVILSQRSSRNHAALDLLVVEHDSWAEKLKEEALKDARKYVIDAKIDTIKGLVAQCVEEDGLNHGCLKQIPDMTFRLSDTKKNAGTERATGLEIHTVPVTKCPTEIHCEGDKRPLICGQLGLLKRRLLDEVVKTPNGCVCGTAAGSCIPGTCYAVCGDEL